jgi:hypothetical protein
MYDVGIDLGSQAFSQRGIGETLGDFCQYIEMLLRFGFWGDDKK